MLGSALCFFEFCSVPCEVSPPDWAGLCFIPHVRVRRRQSHQREPQGPLLSSLLLTCCLCSSASQRGRNDKALCSLLFSSRVWNVEAILRALLPSLCGGWGSFVRSLCSSIVCCSSPCYYPVLQVHRPFSCLAAYGFCFIFLSFYKFLLAFTLVTCC